MLNTLVENLPPAAWSAQLPQIWQLLLTRLQHSGTVKFKRAFSVFMSLMLAKHGPGLVEARSPARPRALPGRCSSLLAAVAPVLAGG